MNRNNKKSIIKNKILNQSLIDFSVSIDQHSDSGLVGISGKICSESKNLLVLEITADKLISVAKSTGIFLFNIDDLEISINGDLLVGNQKSRAKKKYRNW